MDIRTKAPITDYSLWGIFKRYKWPILGTFTLVVIENMLFITQPKLIGDTVDGLIAGDYYHLHIYIGIMLIYAFVTTFRMGYDDRTYAVIRSELSVETVIHQKRADSSLSETSERTALCDEIMGFFENGLFVIVKSIVEVFGAMIMLAYIDIRICIAASCALIFTQLVWATTRKPVRALFTQRNNQRERKVEEIESGDYARITNHFHKIAHIKVKLSDYEAFSFCVFELIGIAVFAYAAFVTISTPGVTAGVLIACFGYIKSQNNAATRLPGIYHAIVGVNEIAGRLQKIARMQTKESMS